MRASKDEQDILWQLDFENSLWVSNYSCATTEFLTGFPLEISPEYLSYRHCSCLPGLYGVPPDKCAGCPKNCICQSGGQKLQWPIGFYPVFRGMDTREREREKREEREEREREKRERRERQRRERRKREKRG